MKEMGQGMNLEYLNTFIEVVNKKNLSAAAKKLHLSQPTVTAQIQKLEQELGCRLIERDTHNFSLTAKGKRVFLFAEYMYQEHKHLLFDLAQIDKGVTGRLTVAASPNIGEYIVPNLISRFREENPALEIIVSIMDAQTVVKMVAEDPEVVGFSGIPPKSPEIDYIRFGEDEMVLIVYPGHPFTVKKQVTLADLIGETLIFRGETVGRNVFFSRILIEAGIDLSVYQPKFIMGTTSGILSAVESKAGIGFVSNLAIKNSEAMGMIKVIKVKNIKLKYQHYFIYNKNIQPDSLLANFVSFIHQNAEPTEQ
jgi:DNA-binding transcriptional LysR family regulator